MSELLSVVAFGARLLPGAAARLIEEIVFLAGFGGEEVPAVVAGPVMALLLLMPLVAFAFVGIMGLRGPSGTLERLEGRYQQALGDLGCVALVVLTVAMSYEVVSRYVFGHPTTWAFELSYILLGSAFMLSIAYCLDRDQHVRVDILYAALSGKGRALIDLFSFLILLPALAWTLIGMIDYFDRSFRIQETSAISAWDPPIWPFKFALLLGSEVLLFRILIGIAVQIGALRGRNEVVHA